MMNKWIAELLAIAISIGSWTPLYGNETHLPSSGKQIVAEVETSYQRGQYDTFLLQLHEEFQNAGRAGALRGIFESAKAALPKETDTERLEKHKESVLSLTRERNQRLLDAISEKPDLEIAQKVDSVVYFSLAPDQGDILAKLDSLKYKIPESAEGTAENKISALETEYYIKSLLLDVASHRSNTFSDDLNKKKIALALEKLDKMEDAAKNSDDRIWIKKIQKAKQAFRVEKAYRIDLDVLQGLAAGKIDPENPIEEKVKAIMMDYLQQKRIGDEKHLSEIAQK